MNRGDRREDIFEDDDDRRRFLETLGQTCEKTGWQAHAYCLMSNHFHLVVETPQPNLVSGMKWLLGTYTSRFNRRHKEFGHVFPGRYKSLIVDGSGNGNPASHCDIAWAGALATHAHTERKCSVGPAVLNDDGSIWSTDSSLSAEQAALWSDDPRIWRPLRF
jgi:REP element-mobilizing transposase RayT